MPTPHPHTANLHPLLAKQRILVTGADGFIGSHLTETLAPLCAEVTALVHYNSRNSWGWLDHSAAAINGDIQVIAGDVRDPAFMHQAVTNTDIVLHLAALIAIPYSYHAPDSYIATNIQGTLNVLQAARAHGVDRMIHTSTSETYGTAQHIPMREDHPVHAQSPYAASKAGADQLALSFYRSFDLPVSVLRPFNTYGPRQSARAFIPALLSQLAAGHQTIKLGDLSPTRDLNYVSDTVHGFLCAAARAPAGETFNLGTGYEASMQQVVDLSQQLLGSQAEVSCDNARLRPQKSEVFRLCADASKARKLLGWQPEHEGEAGLKHGLQRTIDWFQKPENLRCYKETQYNV